MSNQITNQDDKNLNKNNDSGNKTTETKNLNSVKKVNENINRDQIKPKSEKKKFENKIVVVGSGAFGTAIAESLVRDEKQKNEIILFGVNAREVNDINKNHKNSKYYSLKLSPKLNATTNPAKAFEDADIIMLAIPALVVRKSITETIIPNLTKPAYFINLAKGFDYLNIDVLSNIITATVPAELNLGTMKLSGASYASELIHKAPTSFILAAEDIETSKKVYRSLSNKTMKVVPTADLEAVEWLSVLKNPMAILHGMIAGLGHKVNTKALFFTLSINEMRRVLKFLGKDENIVFTPAGIGDLYLTGTSSKSRNYSTGYEIGRADRVTKKSLQKFTTIEGLRSVEILLRISRKEKLNLKTIEMLYAITYNKEKPSEVVNKFLVNLPTIS